MQPVARRRFLSLLGLGLVAPLVPAAERHAVLSLVLGEAKAQQLAEATLFLEFDYRDQVDLMHVMVPPGIATYQNRSVGSNWQELTMFAPQGELKQYPNGVYLTNDSLELAPHIDSIAMLDTGEAGIGAVHGHEAANGMRSPGRFMQLDPANECPNTLYLNDGEHHAGSEPLCGDVPTPASFHNYHQLKLQASLYGGFAFKGISRSKHSVYHYGAGLPLAELLRVHSKQELFDTYSGALMPTGDLALVGAIQALTAPPWRKHAGSGYDSLVARHAELGALPMSLELTPDEVVRWSTGVPNQKCEEGNVVVFDCPVDPLLAASGRWSKAQIWEQFGYASKLLRSGHVRSIALELDYGDMEGDGTRTETVVREQAQQVARPLARLIEDLKAVGVYDRTVIAVYTLDGSRTPAANSYGDNGKGTLLLAGGRVRGGYYGDVVITKDLVGGGHEYGFRAPDLQTGEPGALVTNWSDKAKRTPSAAVWRTVAKAMGIPESEYVGKFGSQLDAFAPLDFMLKA